MLVDPDTGCTLKQLVFLSRGSLEGVVSEGVDLTQVPVLSLAQGPWPEQYATLQYNIAGGNDLLPRRIATQLGDRIQLGCEVIAIDQTTPGATVSFRRAQEHHVVHAIHVVVAVPVPALRHITFVPPLPPEKTAGEVQQLSPEALLETLFHQLAPAISPWQGTPERVITIDWMGDAYAGGGWSVYPVQSAGDVQTIVGEPYGYCLFAGEYLATEYGGTMEGALRSGHEAARMLISQLAGG